MYICMYPDIVALVLISRHINFVPSHRLLKRKRPFVAVEADMSPHPSLLVERGRTWCSLFSAGMVPPPPPIPFLPRPRLSMGAELDDDDDDPLPNTRLAPKGRCPQRAGNLWLWEEPLPAAWLMLHGAMLPLTIGRVGVVSLGILVVLMSALSSENLLST